MESNIFWKVCRWLISSFAKVLNIFFARGRWALLAASSKKARPSFSSCMAIFMASTT